MNSFELFWEQVKLYVPNLLFAIIILAVALLVGTLVKNLIIKGGKKLNLDAKFQTASTSGDSILKMLGNLAFIIILLLFLPAILFKLGLDSVTHPLNGMLNSIIAYLPKLLGAALILAIGLFLAKILKELALMLLKKFNVDNYQEKLGIKRTEENSKAVHLSELLANVLYFFILIPIIIAALNALDIQAISQPAIAILNTIFSMIPQIIGAILVTVLGILIAKLAYDLIYSLISGSGLSEKVSDALEDGNAVKFDLAKIIAEIVRYIIIAFVLVQAFNILNLGVLKVGGEKILLFLPKVIAAVLILIGGYILGSLIKKFVRNNFPNGRFVGMILHYAIMTFSVLAAINQLGIAKEFVLPLFWGLVVAISVASALAFGLGGRDFAKKTLDRLDSAMDNSKETFEVAKAKIAEADVKNEENYKNNINKYKEDYNNRRKRYMDEKEKLASYKVENLIETPVSNVSVDPINSNEVKFEREYKQDMEGSDPLDPNAPKG